VRKPDRAADALRERGPDLALEPAQVCVDGGRRFAEPLACRRDAAGNSHRVEDHRPAKHVSVHSSPQMN